MTKKNIDRDRILSLAEQNLRSNDIQQAKKYFKQFLSIKQSHCNKHIAYYNYGKILLQEQQTQQGIESLKRSICENPNFLEGHLLLGEVLSEFSQFEQSIIFYKKVLLLQPNSLQGVIGIANCYMCLDQKQNAVQYFEQAVKISPDNVFILDKAAFAFFLTGKFDQALEYQLQANSIDPNPEGLFNLAEIYKNRGELDKSIETFRRVIEIKPNWVDAHSNFSHALLMNGEYLEGWKEHEWRRKKRGLFRTFPQPHWDGIEDLTGKTLLLYGEQGFGDTLQFVRYITIIKEKFKDIKIIFECNLPLVSLLKQIDSISEIYSYNETPVNSFDYHCSIISLPHYMGTTIETIPYQDQPYLKADLEKVNRWKQKIGETNKLKVGIVWHGKPITADIEPEVKSVSVRRNISLKDLKDWFDLENIQFYSIQKGNEAVEQIKQADLQDKILDYTDEFSDFSDTAAFIENMDLIIGVDTAMIHLACAIGKNTWMLSRNDGCWRWMTKEKYPTTSPWYSALKIYRQSQWTGWTSEIEQIKNDLQAFKK